MGELALPLHSYRLDTVSNARLVNAFAEKAPEGAKGPAILRRAPGISNFCPCGTGLGRGLHVMKSQLYAVTGTTLYRVSAEATTVSLGPISGTGRIYAIDNGTQLAINSGGVLSVYDGALLPVSDPDVPMPLGPIDFLDSYLLGVHSGTGQFICSALEDFTDFDPLDFATAEGAPDDLLTLKVDHRNALLVGTETSELFENSPSGADFPFTRVVNGFIELGGAAPRGICKQDNSVFWLANDLTLRRLTGATPERVSQHGAEVAWRKYSTVADAEMSSYTLNGHLCVVVRFPTAQATWIYNCTTQEMFERESYNGLAWDISDIAVCYGRIFVQRESTGEIGVLDAGTHTEWGHILRAEWAYQNVYANGDGVQIHRLEMGIETGGAPINTHPHIHLERSRNKGGREGTFKPLSSRSLGTQGNFKRRVHWDALGTGYDDVYRASFSGEGPLTIWNTMIDAEGLKA